MTVIYDNLTLGFIGMGIMGEVRAVPPRALLSSWQTHSTALRSPTAHQPPQHTRDELSNQPRSEHIILFRNINIHCAQFSSRHTISPSCYYGEAGTHFRKVDTLLHVHASTPQLHL